MDSNYARNLSDQELINQIQKGENADDHLRELVNRHSGIYIEMINNYVPSTTIFTNKHELINDKDYNIYQAALKYDPTRGAKFSTYLGNETKWMCLNIYNKNKKNPEVSVEELYSEISNDLAKSEHEESIRQELFNKVIEIIKDYPDERIIKIFTMRYIDGSKNKTMPWKSVSEEIDMSIQGCINIHDSTINKLKIKLKEI